MIPVGKVMPRPMGVYDPAAVYDILDLVSHNNSLWICKVANTVGVEPTSEATDNWQLAINSDVADAVTLEGHGASYFATAESVTNVVNGTTPVAKATSADSATNADTATNANHAISADSATTADSATSANHATSADSATNADHATTADSATAATSATNASAVPWSGVTDKPSSFTPASHNQAASTITAGTFAGQVVANATAVATLGTKQVRNIYAGTAELTAGSSALPTGDIYFQIKS